MLCDFVFCCPFQEPIPLNSIPEPGTFVFVCEMIGGHRDTYRAQVLSLDQRTDGSLTAKVFAVDNGFTKEVSGTCLYVLPQHLLGIPTQVTLLIYSCTKKYWYIGEDRNSLMASALSHSWKVSASSRQMTCWKFSSERRGEVNNPAN